ncbi:MAG: [FeFe] hydrogenase H-cluster maturation GTPase HydF [Lachnospiraceae bacterium]|nr:[FeFe] hydrogenase H-cluster maturation GTPase HydF [Lachnospiraceae bacterium]
MQMNQSPSAERIHIGFFGCRNAGKSSVLNAITGQDLAVVSDIKGTTTDPVQKAMELLPLGPVVLIDTPGIDDEGELGSLRVKKSYQVLNKIDIAILVVDNTLGLSPQDFSFLTHIQKKEIPYAVIFNKSDQTASLSLSENMTFLNKKKIPAVSVSASQKSNITALKEMIVSLAKSEKNDRKIVSDLISALDFIVLVVPIDKAAPKGRLILPQQQTIRDILDTNAISIVTKESEFQSTLKQLGKKPRLVITDSQVFAKISAETPEDIPLTSFSILFARYKGNLATVVKGVTALDSIQDGDNILISEGCTHHRQCDDIGTVKLPLWIREFTGKKPEFIFSSGTDFPEDLSPYRMIIHCGGCMLNEREMNYRLSCATDQEIPITNYGIAIAYMQGILNRSLQPFPSIAACLRQN